jgi:hypothetical protein
MSTKTRSAFDMRNQRKINALDSINDEIILDKIDEFNAHIAPAGTDNHAILNITGLQSALDSKSENGHTHEQYITGTVGYTGDVTVITSVDFVGESATSVTLNIVDGLVTGVS